MSAAYLATLRFNKGEVSPLMYAGADLDFYRAALAKCCNWQVLVQGGLRKRSGFRLVAPVYDESTLSRLLPFEFNTEQAYVLELSHADKIRFITQAGVIQSGGSDYTINHAWSDDQVTGLHYVSVNDTGYYVADGIAPYKLVRNSETDWDLDVYAVKDGPYLSADNTSGTTLTLASRGSLTPDMTSNTAPSGTVASSPSSANAYLVFDAKKDTGFTSSAVKTTISYTLASGTKVSNKYWLSTDKNFPDDAPISWTVEGYDGSNWIVLDTRESEVGWTASQTRFYEFSNSTAYEAYRIVWTAVTQANSTDSRLGELSFNEDGDTMTPFNLTASSTAGINDGTGFVASDVGRAISLRGSDGRLRWALIVSRVSSTVVTVRLYGHAMPDTAPIASWRLGAWSETSGFPRTVSLSKERLAFDGGQAKPTTVFATKQGVFDDFGVSDPLKATDGLAIDLLSNQMNRISWLSEDDIILAGSSRQIRGVGPSDVTQAFSATNLTQIDGPTTGSSTIQPISIARSILFSSRGKTDLHELVTDERGRIIAPIISTVAEHLFKGKIKEWARAELPRPVVYIVTEDGKLIEFVYDKFERLTAFSCIETDGTFESVACISGRDERHDDVYVVVKRTINGTVRRFIEVLEPDFDPESGALEDAFFVDCGLTYEGAATDTITGLDHLEGATVRVLADGGQVDGLVVSSGSITLPNEVTKAHVGLPFKATAITLPVAGPGQDGSLFGRPRTLVDVSLDLYKSGPVETGQYIDESTPARLAMANPKQNARIIAGTHQISSGWHNAVTEGSWSDGEGQCVMQSDNALPSIIRAAVFQFEATP